MNERVVVPSTGIQLSSLAPPHIVEVTKPERGQAITVELRDRHSTTLDFSGLAHETIKLVQVGEKLVVEFDNQSTVTAEPFFDWSGKPFPYIDVEFGAGRELNGEQFSALLSETVGQSAQADADRAPPSAPDFVDPSIDALPDGALPLALLGPESHKSAFAGDDSGANPHALQLNILPVLNIPAPGGAATLVFEGGLLASRGPGESAGSHAGSPAFPVTTKPGVISFTSPDGLQSVSLGGHLLTTSPKTFTDATGSLTASYTFDATTHKGTISYTYTLLDNTVGVPSASFAVVVTDSDGHSNAPGNLVIAIADDTPIARSDTDAVTASQLSAETGNVITGAGTTSGASGADVQGADGGLSIVGVAVGNGPGGANPGTVGAAIVGAFGALTLNADGSYSYARNAGGGSDAFTYTIRDADGSLSHATLTFNVGDSAPGNIVIPPAGNPAAGTEVFEAGLAQRNIGGIAEPAGSHTGNPAFPAATAGTITFTSPDGVQKIELGSLVLSVSGVPQTVTDATGTLTASFTFNAATGQGTINYSYTPTDNTLADPSSKTFAVAVTDLDGDRTQGGNLVITIVDDAPVAISDTDSVAAGQLVTETGNVITGVGTTSGAADAQGADGAVVVGVAAGNTGTNSVGTLSVAGAFGTLTLNANGSYSYAHVGAPGGGTDVFTYTIRDGDGDLSHATLTIAVADSSPGNIVIPPAGNPAAGTEVFEAGRGPRGAEPAGSHTGDPSFPSTTSGIVTFTSPDGVQKIELGSLVLNVGGTPQTLTDATGSLTASFSYDAATGQGTINYSYILLDNTLGIPSASFAVAVTDLDGDRTAGGNLVINIADDAPVAIADTDAVAAGQTAAEIGNVLTGVNTTSGLASADVQGADGGLSIVGVAVGAGPGGANPGTVGAAIVGAFGTLTLNADGSYSYAHTGAPGGATDVFTYTIRDADGSLSHATLSITVADSSPGGIVVPPAGNPAAGTEVFEAGLASRGTEPAGSHTGDPSFPAITSGTITFGFGRAAVGRGLADAGICQNGLRNRIIDQERLRAVFADDIVRGPDTFFGKRILCARCHLG